MRNRVDVSAKWFFFLLAAGFANSAAADEFQCMVSVRDGSRHYLTGMLGSKDGEVGTEFLEFAKSESGTTDMVLTYCGMPMAAQQLDGIRRRNPQSEYIETQWTGPSQKASSATAKRTEKKNNSSAQGGSLTVVPATSSQGGKPVANETTTNSAKSGSKAAPVNGKPATAKYIRGFTGKNCEHARHVATTKGTFVETKHEIKPSGTCLVQGWYTPNPNAAPSQ